MTTQVYLLTMFDSMILMIGILLYVTAFILGFLVGRTTGHSPSPIDSKGSFFKPETRQKRQVEIDEKKFVTTISTDSLVKKGKELGTQTVVDDDVALSASKLAMLKKK